MDKQETFAFMFRAETCNARLRPEYRYWGWQVAGRYQSVYLNLDVCKSYVELVEIQTPKSQTGRGKASKALDWVASVASACKLPIRVRVERFAHCPMNNKQLAEWYVKHGLQVTNPGSTSLF